jgi:hypothetical protein
MTTMLAFLAGVGSSLAVANKLDPGTTKRLRDKLQSNARDAYEGARERIEPGVQKVIGQARSALGETADRQGFASTAQDLARDPRVLGAAGGLLVLYAVNRIGLAGILAGVAGGALIVQAVRSSSGTGEELGEEGSPESRGSRSSGTPAELNA